MNTFLEMYGVTDGGEQGLFYDRQTHKLFVAPVKNPPPNAARVMDGGLLCQNCGRPYVDHVQNKCLFEHTEYHA